jgi:predicted metal-dependent hydrolase
MKDFVSLFTILITVTIFYTYLESKAIEVTYVKSTFDNQDYLVRNINDKEAAAKLLGELNRKIKKIIAKVKDEADNNKCSEDRKIDIRRLQKNYNENNISESSPNNKYTSYSINKGEKIVFCLREKNEEQTLHDINTVVFVAIHELSHLMTKDLGHTPKFWDNMKYLLQHAVNIGEYKKVDYKNNPADYCGMQITGSPLK